jgi:hypothetical protein
MLTSYGSLLLLTAKFSAAALEEVFGERLVTHGLWLPRFVALNPRGGICGGHLKIRVCVNNVFLHASNENLYLKRIVISK